MLIKVDESIVYLKGLVYFNHFNLFMYIYVVLDIEHKFLLSFSS